MGSNVDVTISTSQFLRPMVLTGERAFYNLSDYNATTRAELDAHEPLPYSAVFEFESKITRVVKNIFSHIFFPWKLYQCLHTAYGNIFFKPKESSQIAPQARYQINISSEWKYRRFSLLVDGKRVDAMVMGRPSTLQRKRFMLVSLGITKIYECLLIDHPEVLKPGHAPGLLPMQDLLTRIGANGVFYNYPGMGSSEGEINKKDMQKAHEALLQYIEQKFHADEIIDYGHSFGGANLAETWEKHVAVKGVTYVLVKDRTPTRLSAAVQNLAGRVMAIANRILGWEINSIPQSDSLKYPEIHIMCVNTIKTPTRFTERDQIDPATYSDTVVPYNASTALHYLRNPKKIIIGVPDAHGAPIAEPALLANEINKALLVDVE